MHSEFLILFSHPLSIFYPFSVLFSLEKNADVRVLDRMQVWPVKAGEAPASRLGMLRLTNQCTSRSASDEGIHLIVSMRETPSQYTGRVKLFFAKGDNENGGKHSEGGGNKKKAKTRAKEVESRGDDESTEEKSFEVAWNLARRDFVDAEVDKLEEAKPALLCLFNKIRVFTVMPEFKTKHGLARADTVPFASCFQAALDVIKSECRAGRVVLVVIFILATILLFSCMYSICKRRTRTLSGNLSSWDARATYSGKHASNVQAR